MTRKRILSLLCEAVLCCSLALSQVTEEPVLLTEDDFLELIETLSNDTNTEETETETEEEIVTEEILPDIEIPEADSAEKELPERKALDIEGIDNDLCNRFHNQFLTTHGRQQLVQALIDSAPYRPYIRKQLEEAGLPSVIQYLPIVESNYRIRAVSRSGATGLWQFMENSMAPFLTKNAWYDERYDPWKSTDAAIAKLKDNYRMFNDWALALAAYTFGLEYTFFVFSLSRSFLEHLLLSAQSVLSRYGRTLTG